MGAPRIPTLADLDAIDDTLNGRPPSVVLVSWMDEASFDCIVDDGASAIGETIWDFAMPQGALLSSMADLCKAKKCARDELLEVYEEEDDDARAEMENGIWEARHPDDKADTMQQWAYMVDGHVMIALVAVRQECL